MSSLFAMASAAAFPQEKESEQWWPSSSSSSKPAPQQATRDTGSGGVLSGVSEEEMLLLQKYASWKRWCMISLGAFMFVTGCYNLGLSADNVPSSFLAVYLLFFAGLIVVFELGLQATSRVIVQNFGFLYSMAGRSLFLFFVGVLCISLSDMGKACAAFLFLSLLLTFYVDVKHPKFEQYLRIKHYHGSKDVQRARK